MVETDRLIGEGARQIDYVRKLRFQHPSIEGQPALSQFGESLAKSCIAVQPLGMVKRRAEHLRIGIPCACMANTLEAAGRSGRQRFQHCASTAAQHQVCMAHNTSARPAGAIKSACRLRGNAVDEFDLAHRLQRFAIGAIVERAAFHEDRADNVVARRQVGLQLFEGVMRIIHQRGDEVVMRFGKHRDHRPQIPQVVVRIDDP